MRCHLIVGEDLSKYIVPSIVPNINDSLLLGFKTPTLN